MSLEITVTASLAAYKSTIMSSTIGRSFTADQWNMSGNFYMQGAVLIATSATAIPLGQVTAPHWAYFANKDLVNYVTIRNGSGGADLLQLYPGERCPVPLFSSCVPYAIANGAAVELEYLILSL
jgi:hypothetical protein